MNLSSIIRVPVVDSNIIPNCTWHTVFPSDKCQNLDFDIAQTIAFFGVLFPKRRIRFQKVRSYWPGPLDTPANDSSEMGHLAFGLSDATIPYYNMNPTRAALLKGFLYTGSGFQGLFYQRGAVPPRLQILASKLLPPAFRSLILLALVINAASYILTVFILPYLREPHLMTSSTLNSAYLGKQWGARLLMGLLESQLILVYNSAHWVNPLKSLEGLTEMISRGEMQLSYGQGMNETWSLFARTEGGSESLKRFKAAMQIQQPLIIEWNNAGDLISQPSGKRTMYLTALKSGIVTGHCNVDYTEIAEIAINMIGSYTRWEFIEMDDRKRSVFNHDKRTLERQQKQIRSIHCPTVTEPIRASLALSECGILGVAGAGLYGLLVLFFGGELLFNCCDRKVESDNSRSSHILARMHANVGFLYRINLT